MSTPGFNPYDNHSTLVRRDPIRIRDPFTAGQSAVELTPDGMVEPDESLLAASRKAEMEKAA